MTMAATITQVPVKVDSEKCIAEKGCTVCVDVCPLDVLAIDHVTGKAFMKFDECWYCLPCITGHTARMKTATRPKWLANSLR